MYRLIDHTADLGIEVEGDSLKGLFKNAALSLTHLILGEIPKEDKQEEISLSIEGKDLEDLMVNWLSEILYLFEGEKKVLTDLEIKDMDSKKLNAILRLVPFDPERYEPQSEIKAVTYHQLSIEKKDGKWKARIIFDV